MSVLPIPTGRVSDQYIRQRLLTQLGNDNVDLLKLEAQLSTGKRYALGSEEPSAAERAAQVQRLIERKTQAKTNLGIAQSYLDATDSALSQVANQLTNIRSVALGAISTTATDQQRKAAAQQVAAAIQQLVDTGNQKFRDRYLFAGSRNSVTPFSYNGTNVQYNGNEQGLPTYADTNLLVQTNASGNEVFGGLSEVVRGSADFTPAVTLSTRLADLNGGRGVAKGSVLVSDGVQHSVVDLSGAETIGDVVALLEANPPAGRQLTATVESTGITLQLDASGGGSLTVIEVGGGSTARDLGILHTVAAGTGPFVGSDIDPLVKLTTPITDLFGTKTSGKVVSTGSNNDVIFTAVHNGSTHNGAQVLFVNNGAITPGHETVAFDTLNNRLTFQIAAGSTTANDIVNALNNDATASQYFTAQLDYHDTASSAHPGSGVIDVAATATLNNGVGFDLDRSSGLLITSAGAQHVVTFNSAVTVQDLLNTLNSSGAGVIASINDAGTGIDVRTAVSGADFSIGENGGSTATQLGLRTFNDVTQLSELNHGLGVPDSYGNDFLIQRKDGTQLKYDVANFSTVQDVIDAVNNDPTNQDGVHRVFARLNVTGNGIELYTSDPATTATFQVQSINGSVAAERLGLVPVGASTSASPTSSGATQILSGSDVNPYEVHGVFNALLRLQQALDSGDQIQLSRAVDLLDEAATNMNFARAELGARAQSLDTVKSRLDDEEVSLKSALSDAQDADPVKTISDFTAKQISFQAALQTTAALTKLTLLDYL